MAENDYDDTDDGTADDSRLLRDLRKQIKQQNAELSELRQYRTERLLQKAGFDPDSKTARMLMKLHGDGEQTVEALAATAAEYDIAATAPVGDGEPVDEVAAQRTAATQNIDELRSNATPVGAQQIGWSDYQQLMGTNPDAAAQALQSGQVELPPHVAAVINANRAETASSLTGN